METILDSVPHQPGWAARAVREMARLRKALGDGCTVHHLGATSVPGLPAVPIIDLGMAIEALAMLQAAQLRLMAHGFRAAEPCDRRPVFQARCPPTRQVQVEVTCYLPADPALPQAVALFAHLRARPDAARAYDAMKREARARHADHAAYRAAKQEWVQRQLATILVAA